MRRLNSPGRPLLVVLLVATMTSEVTAIQRPESGRRTDLSAFRTEFLDEDRSYSPTERAEALKRLDALERDPDTLTDAGFELRLAEIAALADNGHTLLFPGPWQDRYNRVPLAFLTFQGRIHVGWADPPHDDLIGAEVLEIEGLSVPEVRGALTRFQGGLPGWRDTFLHFFLESPEILHAAGLASDPDVLRISGRTRDGKAFERSVSGEMIPSALEGFEQFVPPSRMIELARRSDDPDSLPLFLRDPESVFNFRWLEGDIAYVQFRANGGPLGDARAFSADVEAALTEREPRHVIVDQRLNFGGDLGTTRDLMQALPELVPAPGLIFVLTSGRTFSAGISSVGYLKQAGGERVVILGEPVGDRLSFWAEGDLVTLPISGAAALYATERHDYVTGCPEPECHGSIQRHPIRVESLAPDRRIAMTYADLVAGRDPLMEAVMDRIASLDRGR